MIYYFSHICDMVYAFVQIQKCNAQTDKMTSTTYYYANFVPKLSLILHHLLSNFGYFGIILWIFFQLLLMWKHMSLEP